MKSDHDHEITEVVQVIELFAHVSKTRKPQTVLLEPNGASLEITPLFAETMLRCVAAALVDATDQCVLRTEGP